MLGEAGPAGTGPRPEAPQAGPIMSDVPAGKFFSPLLA
jgi:hypothetical protein